MSPVDPLLATDSILILRDAGPSQLGANEFNRLFNQDEVLVSVEGIVGELDTLGNQIVLSGLVNRLSFALSQFHYETEGFVGNDSAERTVYDVFVHGQVSDAASVQLDVQRSELDVGQTFFPFDPELAEQDAISEETDSARLSGHYVVNPGNDWILSTAYEDRQRAVTFVPEDLVFTTTDASTWSVEVQNLYRLGSAQVVTGLGCIEEEDDFDFEQGNVIADAANLYAYGQWKATKHQLSILAGFAESGSSDQLAISQFDREEPAQPKLGVGLVAQEGNYVACGSVFLSAAPFHTQPDYRANSGRWLQSVLHWL